MKTNAVIGRALDGVLFIDEAYQLSDQRSGFGTEAVATLMPGWEDRASSPSWSPATRTRSTNSSANPGLPRRFSEDNRIRFPDYQPDELMRILCDAMTNEDLTWTPSLEIQLREIVTAMYDAADKSSGTPARWSRWRTASPRSGRCGRPARPSPRAPTTFLSVSAPTSGRTAAAR